MNLQSYNDKILHIETVRASRTEKSATVNLLKHLQEVSRRKLYVDYGHSTLPKYIVSELGYSENEAWTRIQAMRLLGTVPEIEDKIESGQISLSNASALQGFIRDTGIQNEPEKIAEAVKKAEDLTNRKLKDEFKPQAPKEKKITLNLKLQEKIKKLQQSWGEMSEAEILEALIDEKLKALELKIDDYKQRPTRPVSSICTRYLPVSVKREIFERSKNQCEFKSKDGTRCLERRNLQYDHVRPFALNGGRTVDNIRMLCFAHNQRRSIQTFGYLGRR
ncbi:MAG TPA: HNH endonuclease signature motif containing protein [Bacteriovoracaceae bacterium]|nr:HNH endonuclease signature motif containing protein [Bacteriovoracaceae bacterium]